MKKDSPIELFLSPTFLNGSHKTQAKLKRHNKLNQEEKTNKKIHSPSLFDYSLYFQTKKSKYFVSKEKNEIEKNQNKIKNESIKLNIEESHSYLLFLFYLNFLIFFNQKAFFLLRK